MSKSKKSGPKVLLLDIETAPILAHVWGIWQENVGLNQIKKDWHILSWAAKWLDEDKMFYQDNRKAGKIDDDSKILQGIWDLMDEADIIVTHNGKKFDEKKLNTRFIINGLSKPSSYKHIDTLQIAKKHFAPTSFKLEHLAKILKVKFQKSQHKKFPGFALWEACLAGIDSAWKEMEHYNKQDVLVLEAVFKKLRPWATTLPNFAVYYDGHQHVCSCGSKTFKKNGFDYTNSSKFQRYKCKKCGAETRDAQNLLSREKKNSLRRNVK